jgi:hypothetical protein
MQLREGNAWAVGPGTNSKPRDDMDRWNANLNLQAEIIQRGIDEGSTRPGEPRLLGKMITAVYQVQLADGLERGPEADPDRLVARIQHYVRRLLGTPESS